MMQVKHVLKPQPSQTVWNEWHRMSRERGNQMNTDNKERRGERADSQSERRFESSWHRMMFLTVRRFWISHPISLLHTKVHKDLKYTHRLSPSLFLLFFISACPTSIKSTPKMIICLRQIILGKAIYRITIELLYPPSQTSSLESECVSVCVYGLRKMSNSFLFASQNSCIRYSQSYLSIFNKLFAAL